MTDAARSLYTIHIYGVQKISKSRLQLWNVTPRKQAELKRSIFSDVELQQKDIPSLEFEEGTNKT